MALRLDPDREAMSISPADSWKCEGTWPVTESRAPGSHCIWPSVAGEWFDPTTTVPTTTAVPTSPASTTLRQIWPAKDCGSLDPAWIQHYLAGLFFNGLVYSSVMLSNSEMQSINWHHHSLQSMGCMPRRWVLWWLLSPMHRWQSRPQVRHTHTLATL